MQSVYKLDQKLTETVCCSLKQTHSDTISWENKDISLAMQFLFYI